MTSPNTNVVAFPGNDIVSPPAPRRSITTRNAFAHWASTTSDAPELVDPGTYKSWSPARRRTYDQARLTHHHHLQLIPHPWFQQAHQAVSEHLQAAYGAGLDSDGVALIGPSMSGKTTLLHSVMADHYHHPPIAPFHASDAERVPVLYVIAGAEATTKQLLGAALSFYSPDYYTNELVEKLEDRLRTLITECGTTLVVVDEVHRVRPIDSQRRATGDVLRGIQNHTAATVLMAGVTDDIPGLFDPYKGWGICEADQLQSRFTRRRLNTYNVDTDRDDLLRVIHNIWRQLRLVNEPPEVASSVLADHVHTLVNASGGKVGIITKRLARAANIAINTGEERLTRKNLDA